MVQLPSWNESYPWISRCLERVKRTFYILDDARLDVDDDVIDVGNGDISAVIVVPPKAHFLPIPDPAPSSPDPCSNTQGIRGWDQIIERFQKLKFSYEKPSLQSSTCRPAHRPDNKVLNFTPWPAAFNNTDNSYHYTNNCPQQYQQ